MLLVLGGCAVKHPTTNLVHGKVLFVAKCGACHTLSHASTTGTVGPNLDDAFRQDRADGIKSTSIQGLISYWIQYPNTQGAMPAFLYKGQSAEDVAAYVAQVAAKPGVDTGALATAVQAQVPITAAAGKTVFTGVGGCGSCHKVASAGTSGTAGPDLARPMLSLDGGPDGAVSADGRVAGCYLHGLFASDSFRHAFLARLGAGGSALY